MKNRLTEKQNSFAIGVAEGLSQSDAYRQAYSADGMRQNVIHVEASRLAGSPKVALRVEELSRQKDTDHRIQAIRRRNHVLDELERQSKEAPTASARVRALELLGKSVGLFEAKVIAPPTKNIEELESELLQLLRRNSYFER